jgi:hypothetical protein
MEGRIFFAGVKKPHHESHKKTDANTLQQKIKVFFKEKITVI